MAQVILVTSGRGGAGKSTVCAYLGAALAACGKRVLLIEGSHRSLDVLLGVQDRVLFDLADALDRRCELSDATIRACGMSLICAPLDLQPIVDIVTGRELRDALDPHFDFVLIEVDGSDHARLPAFAAGADRAVVVSAADAVSARACRAVTDALDTAGVRDIRLCVNMLTRDFLKLRPIPDLDWLIDQVCAQLIAVLPFDEGLVTPMPIGQNINLSNVSKIIFDNFAQRILGNYIDLLVQ